MKALLLCFLLAGCATTGDMAAKCEAGGGCVTLLKTRLFEAVQKAWNDGYGKGWDKGEDNIAASCMRAL